LSDFIKTKDVIFSIDDIRPFFTQILSVFEMMYRAVKYKKSLLGATSFDIEWNGDE
jgi:hypothetical protein